MTPPPFPSDPAHPAHRFPPPGCGWVKVVDDAPCAKQPGHTDVPHRCYSPYGDGRWVDYDVATEAELQRSVSWLRTDPDLISRGWVKTFNRRLASDVLVPPAGELRSRSVRRNNLRVVMTEAGHSNDYIAAEMARFDAAEAARPKVTAPALDAGRPLGDLEVAVVQAAARELARQLATHEPGVMRRWDAAALARAVLEAAVGIDTADGSLLASVAAGRHDEAFALLSAVDGVKATGGAVEIAGVRIEACDDRGRTATMRAMEEPMRTACPHGGSHWVENADRTAPAPAGQPGELADYGVDGHRHDCKKPGSIECECAANPAAYVGPKGIATAYVEGQLLLDEDGDPIAMAVGRDWARIIGDWRTDAALVRFVGDHAARALADAWSAAVEDEPAPLEVAQRAHLLLGLGDVELVEGGGAR
jgi:hypothetical protein